MKYAMSLLLGNIIDIRFIRVHNNCYHSGMIRNQIMEFLEFTVHICHHWRNQGRTKNAPGPNILIFKHFLRENWVK